ncbi:uncharacterized protein LOC112024073 isoform X5 [Quercus suber]|uniref:uncharacterized protein LOC112024073 isoform X5 n=1 Tax=Quercus suber TaxID=58331 RepID=UPI0032DE334E
MEILTHLGFEEYINLILDNAGKVNIKRQSKKPLGLQSLILTVPLPSFTRTTILHMAGTYGFFSHSHGGLLSGCNNGFCWDCSKHELEKGSRPS